MPMDRFLIAPFQTGLQQNARAWQIMDDAFALLENAYVFRGRVRKRFGSQYMGANSSTPDINQLNSRLRIALTGGAGVGVTNGAGLATGTVPGVIFKPGQAFSIGTEIFTVQATGTPVVMLTTGAATTHTYNTTTGVYAFNGAAAATQVYFYPAESVMGIDIYDANTTNNATYAWDTQFGYIFAGGAWSRSGTAPLPIWHGTDTDFFWALTFRYPTTASITAFLVTNFFCVNPNGAVSASDDPIYYLPSTTNVWTAFTPKFLVAGAGNFVKTARLLVSFKGRLVLLNTIERDAANATNSNYPNRARFSQVGDPFNVAAFYEITQVGALGGGVIDAPTSEAIVTCEFIKDRLIVYFERSVYEFAWTGNDVVPFEWRKLDNELGSESTFSVIPFNLECLAIGATGVHSCNGSNVKRIDDKIPDKIWTIKNAGNGINRVAGVRDYWTETVYWAYPANNNATVDIYPNKVLVYNYKNDSWAENDDCITAFGYFEQGLSPTWANMTGTWEEALDTWNSGYIQAQTRQVLAGNQEGYTFLVSPEVNRNAAAMQITNATLSGTTLTLTIVDHNLLPSGESTQGDYIAIEGAHGATNLNNLVLPVNAIPIDPMTMLPSLNQIECIVPTGFTLPATYTGGGVVSRVSNIQIRSKQWNPYDKQGRDVYVAKIDFCVKRTSNGEITVDYLSSDAELSMTESAQATNSILGSSILETKPYDPNLYPFETVQDRLWHPVYYQVTGECIQLWFYFDDTQMRNTNVSWSGFELEGLVLHTQPTSYRLQ